MSDIVQGQAGSPVYSSTAKANCDRVSGNRPRNRQARMLEYYFGREQVCLFVPAGFFFKIIDRNPYRTQATFSVRSITTPRSQIGFGNSLDMVKFPHYVFALTCISTLSGPGPYTENIILSYPTHGPLVGEEWWCFATNDASVDFTGYLYSD